MVTISQLRKMKATGWYHIERKHTIDKVLINRGFPLYKCTYLKFTQQFKSDMHSDYNFLFCGGFGVFENFRIMDEYILNQVIYRAKSMGFVKCYTPENVKHIVDEARSHGLAVKITDECTNERNKWDVGFCVSGKFSELFDLDALAADYCEYLKISGDTMNFDFIEELRNIQLEDFLGFDYAACRKSDEEIIITGLILGYPIETTAAILTYSNYPYRS
jgi:hypothetical protein